MRRNILISVLIIVSIWVLYPIVHLIKVKWSEDLIEYVAPPGYVNHVMFSQNEFVYWNLVK